jgi:hypothetical protein
MTDLDSLSEPPADAALLVVEAFLDGEPVDRAALSDALADAGAREHLVDLLALRGGVASLGSSAWSAARPPSRRRWLAAAAVVVLSVGTGFIAGQRTIDASGAPAVETVVEQGARVEAPKPTRVISLQPGVNWTESTGGK